MKKIAAVLFDLDGTLLDTAPDLSFTINTLLELHQRPPLPYSSTRSLAGHGGRSLITAGFNIATTDPQFAHLWQMFLQIYEQNICRKTQLFPGMEQVLSYLNNASIPWGIVTNKPKALTQPLLKHFELLKNLSCVVCGDTLNKSKPDPEPLLHACALLNVPAADCVYIGDAERDIQASKSAGMPSLIARYGYIADTDPFAEWGADGLIENPLEIIHWLKNK